MQPTSCAEVTSPSSRPCGPPLSPKTGTAGADSADCESVLSPISPVENEQQPRLLNSQPISLSSVPHSIPKTAHPLPPADEDCSVPLSGSIAASTHQVTNTLPSSLTCEANQPADQDVSLLASVPAPSADHQSPTSIINLPVSNPTPALADCSVNIAQDLTKLSSSAPEASVQPSHSSPTPTTSTSLPLSAHGTSDCGSDLRAQSPHPIHDSSAGPAQSASLANHVTEPFDSAQYPAQTTSSLSPPLSPVDKSPSPQATAQLHGHHNGVPLVPPAHVNGSGLLSANGDASKALDVVQEQVIPDPSSTSQSSLPSLTAQPMSQIVPSPALAFQTSMSDSTAPIVSPGMPNGGSQVDWLVPGSIGSRFSRDQHRFAIGVLKYLKKQRVAVPFLHPVDPEKLHIPDYPTVIKHPMDLATVETRLGKSKSISSGHILCDIRLVKCMMPHGFTSLIFGFSSLEAILLQISRRVHL